MTRKTDKRQNPGARSINRRALATVLDKLPGVRQKLLKRIGRAIRREDLPVTVLHQVAQCIEMWGDDKEE
jgi:hypothetical protein